MKAKAHGSLYVIHTYGMLTATYRIPGNFCGVKLLRILRIFQLRKNIIREIFNNGRGMKYFHVLLLFDMSIRDYFKPDPRLPDLNGPLSTRVPSSSIRAANDIVKPLLSPKSEILRKDRQYAIFSLEEKAKIVKCAAEIGVTCAIRKLSKQYPDRCLKESTVRTWVTRYKEELRKKRDAVDGTCMSGASKSVVEKLESKK